MFVLFLLLQITVLYNSDEKFDLKKVDYCATNLTCDGRQNTVCNCRKTGYRREILDSIVEFRKAVLEKHNYYRELVASGKETRGGLTSAADMQALSYSLELEYMARCLSRNVWIAEYKKCRKMSNSINANQNLAYFGGNAGIEEQLKWIKAWYGEIVDFAESDNTIDIFKTDVSRSGTKINHFTLMIWSTITQLGCTRSYTPLIRRLRLRFVEGKVRPPYSLLCLYACEKPDSKLVGNLFGNPIYKRGKPCSACHFGKCENPKYPSLCGTIKPVPTDPPHDIPNIGATRIFSTVTTCRLYFSLLISLICLYCN